MREDGIRKCGGCGRDFFSRLDNNFCESCQDDGDPDEGFDDCQHCGKAFDEIDREYQICSYCLYDSERKIFTKGKRKRQWEGDF